MKWKRFCSISKTSCPISGSFNSKNPFSEMEFRAFPSENSVDAMNKYESVLD